MAEPLHSRGGPQAEHVAVAGDGADEFFVDNRGRGDVGIADWATAFGNATVAAAMLDRLLHRATVVGIDGPVLPATRHQRHADTIRAAARAAA